MASRRLGSSSTTRMGKLCSAMVFNFALSRRNRQGNDKFGAVARLRKQFYRPTMRSRHAERNGQTQAGSLPLGGKKRLEDARLHFTRNTRTAVAHANCYQ